ncbi:MAG: spondin domain-containing protein [Bdellovibrionales bacterium]|nr:spondin domain-containing protein [Bdellovibrionales bacterium]
MLKTHSSVLSLVLFASALPFASAHAGFPGARFRVTVQNVTPGNGVSPFLVGVLKAGHPVFEVGKPASVGLATIAETGNAAPLADELRANPETLVVTQAAGGPIGPSESRSVEFDVSPFELRSARLNVVGMIGRSNDSFVAIRDFPLATVMRMGEVNLRATNYDAGSEENTGSLADFGPGGHPTAHAEGFVTFDRGLNPRGDAGDLVAWGSVAATVKIERIR